MNRLKPLLLLLLIVLSGFSIQVGKPNVTQWVITKGCSLKVAGSTNINKFNCGITNYCRPDTLTLYKTSSTDFLKITGSLKLDVQNFDCHNPVMTSDLRKTLKSKEFPKLIIKFISLGRYPVFNDRTDAIKGVVMIELAGVSKRFDVDYKFISEGSKSLTLIGNRQINFSDFNLVPPRRLGGMIQTNNELQVEFNLKMKVLD